MASQPLQPRSSGARRGSARPLARSPSWTLFAGIARRGRRPNVGARCITAGLGLDRTGVCATGKRSGVMSERTRGATARRPPGSLSATRMALWEGWRGFCMYGGPASDENASEGGKNLGRERLPSPGVFHPAPLARGPATPIHALLRGAGELLLCPNSDCSSVND